MATDVAIRAAVQAVCRWYLDIARERNIGRMLKWAQSLSARAQIAHDIQGVRPRAESGHWESLESLREGDT